MYRRWSETSLDSESDLDSHTTDEYAESQFEWNIADFFSLIEPAQEVTYESSEFLFGINYCILRLHRLESSDVWTLFIVNHEMDDTTEIRCVLGFKKVDGSLEEFPERKIGIESHREEDKECFINHWTNSELLERKSELTATQSLTITCTLKMKYNLQRTSKDQSSYTKLTKLDTLSDNFKSLLTKKGGCDVTLHVQDTDFNVHKIVLIARSPVFAAMFRHDMTEKQTGTINIPDCEPFSFGKFLEYLYCGILVLEHLSFQNVFHLYSISNKYDIQELRSFCAQYMEQSLTEDNICDVIVLAEINNDEKLWSAAQEFFYKNSAKVVNSPKWKSMSKNNPNIVNKIIVEMASRIKV